MRCIETALRVWFFFCTGNVIQPFRHVVLLCSCVCVYFLRNYTPHIRGRKKAGEIWILSLDVIVAHICTQMCSHTCKVCHTHMQMFQPPPLLFSLVIFSLTVPKLIFFLFLPSSSFLMFFQQLYLKFPHLLLKPLTPCFNPSLTEGRGGGCRPGLETLWREQPVVP